MNNVNKTLYIPLYGKAFVSRKGILLSDPKAEEIWAVKSFPLKGKSKSKWLAYYMGMRSAIFDDWLKAKMQALPNAVILHLGCGMDSRIERVVAKQHTWYDVDFPEVIAERKRYYKESTTYHMLASDVRNTAWLDFLPKDCPAIVLMEGISMYLSPNELTSLLQNICNHFEHVALLMDCYTTFASKASKYKNPINDVGVTTVYGIDDPKQLEKQTGLTFVQEHEMTPAAMINQLHGSEKWIFQKIYGGSISKKMYRLYEYSKN